MNIKFYMSGGHVIMVKGIKEVTMTRDSATGRYTGYEVTYEANAKKKFLTLSIPDIVAVAEE